ncbi:hypothetical protein MRX96_058772 [Rhipicephalus microplus]
MFAVCGRVSAGTPPKPNGADSGTISASFYVLAGDRRTSTAKCVCRGGVCDAYAIVRTVARMFAVFGRASAGTPAKPNGADSGTISASFDVLAGDRRTSTVNRVSRGGARDADAKVGSAARIFAVFGGVSGGTPVKPRSANSRTILASFDVPAGHRRTSTANLVCRGGICDADAKVGTAARMFAVFGRVSAGTPAKRKSVNASTKVAYLDVLDGVRRRSTKNHVSRGERPTAVWVLIAAIVGAPRQTQKKKWGHGVRHRAASQRCRSRRALRLSRTADRERWSTVLTSRCHAETSLRKTASSALTTPSGRCTFGVQRVCGE